MFDDAARTVAVRIALTLAMLPALSAAPPRMPKVVSINPCIDAVLLRVAGRAQIAGSSHYSQDARGTSIPLDLARRFNATSGTAEEVIALRPDLVLSGAHVDPATIAALARMRIRLVQYPVAATVAESIAQVRDIAMRTGHRTRGEVLAARIESAARPVIGTQVPALIWQGEGLVPGAGTLSDELLRRAGFRNMSAAYGLKQWDVLPLEYLIARPPRVLFSTSGAKDDRMTSHPALRHLARRIAVVPFPARLMNCAGPTIIAAMARLKQVRAEVAR